MLVEVVLVDVVLAEVVLVEVEERGLNLVCVPTSIVEVGVGEVERVMVGAGAVEVKRDTIVGVMVWTSLLLFLGSDVEGAASCILVTFRAASLGSRPFAAAINAPAVAHLQPQRLQSCTL